jgi:hypothetical protein
MTVTTSSLDGMFKTRYADKIEKLQPSFNILSRDIPFSTKDKLGKDYRFPVRLRRSMGVTYNGGASYGNAFTLNSAVSGLTKEATVSGTEFVLRENISYGAIKGATDNMGAFGSAFDEVVSDMTTSAAFHRELTLLYGGTSLGAITGTPGQPTAVTATCVISAASWAAGLWVQMEGGLVDVYDATLTTLRNDSGAGVSFEVTAINVATRTLTLTGEATDIDAIADTDVLVPHGALDNWFTGIDGILTNAGTLFGIAGATYGAWLANSYAAGSAALTMAKLTAATAKGAVRSGMRDYNAYVSTFTYTDLNNDHSALRRFAESTKGGLDLGTVGNAGAITYYGPSGSVSIVPHPMIKAGEAMVIDPACFKRIGTTDTTFNLPDAPGSQENFFHQLPDAAGVGLRCYWDQGVICTKPNAQIKITGIVNTAS